MLLTKCFNLPNPYVFTAGWLHSRQLRIIAAPLPPDTAPQDAVLLTPADRDRQQRTKPGFYVLSLAALLGCATYEGAATAYARSVTLMQVLSSPVHSSLANAILGDSLSLRFGAIAVQDMAHTPPVDDCAPSSIQLMTAKSLKAEHELRQLLLTFLNPNNYEEELYLRQWGAAIHPFDPSDIPPQACHQLPNLQRQALVQVPFSYPAPIVATRWKDRKNPQRCSVCPDVTHCSQLILNTSRCAGAIAKWWDAALHDFELLAKGQPLHPRQTPTIALGQDCLRPCARNCIWDCRFPPKVVPLDYVQPIDRNVPLSLDRQALVDAMWDWPDQELRSHMAYGVRFGAELPLQLVLTPQLKSLAAAFDRTQLELKDLTQRGWYGLFDYFPFLPMRMHPKGATERKLENRPRPTTDGSHPRETQNVRDTQGERVISINDAIRSGIYDLPSTMDMYTSEPLHPTPQDPSWWEAFATWDHSSDRIPKEYKPTLAAVARDSAILAYPARCDPNVVQPIYTFVDDFRNYFSQLPVAPEDWWKTVVAAYSRPHLDDTSPPHIKFVAEYRLGFGITINSNVAQRLANFVIHLFLQEFHRSEAAFLASEPVCVRQWIHQRRQVSRATGRLEDTLFRVHIYTDDPVFIIVGAARTVRALRLWRSITTRFRFLMAIPQKRKVGTMVKWLGFLPSPMHGIVAVPRNKLLRAIAAVQQALASQLTVDKYRSLLGFLEHLKVLLPRPRLLMYGLYRPLRRGQEIDSGPASLVRADDIMRDSFRQWLQVLSTTAVAPVTFALPRARRAMAPGACYFISSDAAKDGAALPALAGFMHGLFWQLPLSSDLLSLPIAALEFLATALSIIMFAPLLDHAPNVVLQTDSLTTAFVLAHDAARSPFIVLAHATLLETPEYTRLLAGLSQWRRVAVTHVYGQSNVAADHLSRGDLNMFRNFCDNFDMRPQRLPLSDSAQSYLKAVFERYHPELPKEAYGRGRAPSSAEYDGPFFAPRIVYNARPESPQLPTTAAIQRFEAESSQRPRAVVPPATQLAFTPSADALPLLPSPAPPPVHSPGAAPAMPHSIVVLHHSPPSHSTLPLPLPHVAPVPSLLPEPAAPLSLLYIPNAVVPDQICPPSLPLAFAPATPALPPYSSLPQPLPLLPSSPSSSSAMPAPRSPVDPPSLSLDPIPPPSPVSFTPVTALSSFASVSSSTPQHAPSPAVPYDKYALHPRSSLLSARAFQAHRDELVDAAVPPGTKASEKSSWAKWVAHCQLWGTEPWRDNLEAYSLAPDANPARDTMLTLVASFIESSYLAMEPRTHGTHPKPTSAYKNWVDVARMHRRRGLPRLDPYQLCQFVKALSLQYKQRHGFDALLERRKEPITDQQHQHLLNLPDHTSIGPYLYVSNSKFGLTWRALLSVLNYSGFRKAEWSVRSRQHTTLMTYRQLAWEVDSVPQRHSLHPLQRAQIRLQKIRAVALIYPVPSKCDQDGSAFCNKGIPFMVDPLNPEAPGSLLLRLEELVDPPDRAAAPLFSDDAGRPFLAADLDRALRDALALLDPAAAATRSWHSYRIRLASKLRAARTPSGQPMYNDAVIQALVRWKTASSIRTYARYDTQMYSDILASIDHVDITNIQFSNLPEISEYDRYDTLADTAHELLELSDSPPFSRPPSPSSRSARKRPRRPQHPSAALPLPKGQSPSQLLALDAPTATDAAPAPSNYPIDTTLPCTSFPPEQHYWDRSSSRRPPVLPK